MNIYEKIELNKELVLKIERSVSTAWARKKSTDEIVDEIVKAITDRDQALQLQQTGVSGRSEQLCGNLDENYNCKNMCLTRCVDGNKFYK